MAIGGFAANTTTEELHTSLKLQKRGYRSVYHARSLAFGLAPSGVATFVRQRDPKRIGGRSTREAIAAAVDRLARAARPGDTVFIVLVGHGAPMMARLPFSRRRTSRTARSAPLPPALRAQPPGCRWASPRRRAWSWPSS